MSTGYEYETGYQPRTLHDLMTEGWLPYSTDDSKVAARSTVSPVKNETVKKSRIRVQLSRSLTWAEKEWLETDKTDPHYRRIDGVASGVKLWVAPNFEHVWAEADFGSRILFDIVAAALESNFVNVYPKAVRTFREYNGE
jgi:hypothetical protein